MSGEWQTVQISGENYNTIHDQIQIELYEEIKNTFSDEYYSVNSKNYNRRINVEFREASNTNIKILNVRIHDIFHHRGNKIGFVPVYTLNINNMKPTKNSPCKHKPSSKLSQLIRDILKDEDKVMNHMIKQMIDIEVR